MKRIVLVENNPSLVEKYCSKLKEAGFQVRVVGDGEDIMAVLEETKPDLLVLDIVMPRGDGWSVLNQINCNYACKGMKTLVLSNFGEKNDIKRSLDLGAAEYLIKSHYTPDEIVEEIKKILN